MTKEEFLEQAWAAARASSAQSGLPAEITVAQAALESRHGESQLSRQANNYFGIKARKGEPAIALPTWEVFGGRRVQIKARFARYASMEECFAARDAMILRLPCYAEARASAADAERFVRALARHWATDPEYSEKVLAIATAIQKVGNSEL